VIEYLSFMNSGGIYVQASYTNLLIQYNNFGNIPCCNGPYPQSTGLYFDGGNQSSNTAQNLTNTTIQWNTIGDSNSCLTPASAFADIVSADGDGNAGGCNGMIFNTTLNGVTIVHNNIYHVSEGTHVNCPGGGNPGVGAAPCEPASNGVTISNLTVEYNDFSNIHRMNWEQQPQTSSGVVWEYNTVHDMLDQTGFSFGMSFACCIVGAGSPYLNVSNNVVQFNTPPYGVTSSGTPTTSASNCVGTYNGVGVTCPPRYGYGIELWGTNANANNNWIGVAAAYATAVGITWGYDGAQPAAQIATQNNNTICGAGFAAAGYYGPEVGQSKTPTQVTGNATGSTCSAVTSVAPTISSASGSFSGSQTVTFTDLGYTSGPQPLGNTGIWYTTDGSTPVAGTHGTYISSGGSITTSATTIKAVGMWGAQNQTTSYASGLGFAPSAVVTATYTSGTPTAATPMFSPAAEAISAITPVTVTSSTTGAVLHCTTDGSTPTSASPVYSAPFSVASTETLSCIATAASMANSGIGTASYSFTTPTLVGAYLGTPGGANAMTGGSTLQFSAYCYYNNGVTDNCSSTDQYGYAVTQWFTSNNGVLSIAPVGSGSAAGLVLATGGGTAYIEAMIGSITSSEWVVTVAGGSPSSPAITVRGRVTFKGHVSPN
jgi:hypothetical protein